jgi:2-oxo-4-hydroxy-4-carboxy-5-ureidoimidazoline decarboxylase
VLDTHGGMPAAGLAIDLVEIGTPTDTPIVRGAVTNHDGRTDRPLIAGRPIPIGTYELRFSVGAYFAKRGVPRAEPPFLDVVPVRFSIAEPEGRYHVPLLVSPWSYTTYRGS